MEGVNSKIIKQFYKYRQLVTKQVMEDSKEVTQEYRSGVMDPARIVAKMEKSSTNRKRIIV